MQKAKQPSKQLNSESIKGAALCYISPLIVGKCSIVAAKCVCNVKEKFLEKSWSKICEKRDTCDKALSEIRNVAFFFSAITAQEGKKTQVRKGEDDGNDTDDSSEERDSQLSQIPIVTSSERLDGNRMLVTQHRLRPGISYWIALTTPNGAPASPLVVLRALIECGIEAVANQVPCQERKESGAMKELYKVFKDHKNPFMQDLVRGSFEQSYRKEVQHILSDTLSARDVENCGTENVVKLTCVNRSYQSSLSQAIGKLMDAKLTLDTYGLSSMRNIYPKGEENVGEHAERRLSNSLTVLVNDIDIAMKSLGYATYRGKVYKKIEESKYTFAFKVEPRAFVNSLATNESFKGRLLKDMRKVIEILSDPFCQVISPLAIDYDLIEVNNGMCWSIKQRKFLECPIPCSKIGQVSPRAYCKYDSSKEPDPKYFKEILENSLNGEELGMFCEDFVKILNYNQKRHKDKVPCLVGETNSGKSSLFFPILGLVHHGNIATITKQKAFNKSMITRFTEVIYLDEATESVLSIDDWKTLTQGGFAAYDVKYEKAKSFINRCPMWITAQHKLQFGKDDQPAMDQRLRNYHFRSLPRTKRRAASWLKNHPMDCLVWAANQARRSQEDDHAHSETDNSEESEPEEGVLGESEKEALRMFTISESPERIPGPNTDDSDSTDVGEELATGGRDIEKRITRAKKALEHSVEGSLRHRQIQSILSKEKRELENERHQKKERHERRKQVLRAKGVSTQHLKLLPPDASLPLPTPIRCQLGEYQKGQEMLAREERRQTAKNVFQNAWLRKTEIQLHEYVMRRESEKNPQVLCGIKGMIEVLARKLWLHHTALGTAYMTEALEERKVVCVVLGLLNEADKHQVVTVGDPLPLQREKAADESSSDGEAISIAQCCSKPTKRKESSSEGEGIFITQCSNPPKRKKQKRGLGKQNNTLDRYFSSQ